MKPFWKLLNKKQVKHLRESRIRNEKQFWAARHVQRSDSDKAVDDACLECRSIEVRIICHDHLVRELKRSS